MHKTKIGLIILALLLTGIAHASAVSVNLDSTSGDVFERVAALSQYGIDNWTDQDSPIYDPAVFKAYGEVPPIHNATQMNEFADKLRSVRENSWNETDFYPNGHVVQYGSDPRCGYFLITLYNDGTAYSEKHTQKIYDVVDKYAIKNGIEDVPVVFVLTNSTDVGYAEFAYMMYDLEDESTDNNTSQELSTANTTISNISETNTTSKSIPLPGILGSLLAVFLAGLIGRRKP
ncbi:hypothetical protein [Methanolobus sp.]|uniref:hypothetical protein n=1 Tax=Methanolobus sp. TaxID=1874737 RepID=UPI0025D54F4E|nr:hypothetical protein [Methanolobus sp.]